MVLYVHIHSDLGVEDTLLFVDWKASLIPVRPIEARAFESAREGQGERTRSRCLDLSGKRQVTNSYKFWQVRHTFVHFDEDDDEQLDLICIPTFLG